MFTYALDFKHINKYKNGLFLLLLKNNNKKYIKLLYKIRINNN